MFKSNTLFIIGAGAGKEIGLPIGSELSDRIAQKVNFAQDPLGQLTAGDQTIRRLLLENATKYGTSLADFYAAGRQIAKGLRYSRSIDEFINKHKDNQHIQYCSKLAIAQAMVESERNSAIFIQTGESSFQRQSDVDSSWMMEFVRILHDGLAKTDMSKLLAGIKIITFNYDRSLEHLLFFTLQYSYGVSDGVAAEALADMPIVHPYGDLGRLSWQVDKPGLPFGRVDYAQRNLPTVAHRIRTFYEQLQDEGEMNEIRCAVAEAEQIIFLGFGFHPQNVEMIRANRVGTTTTTTTTTTRARRIYATAFGESAAGCAAIRDAISGAMGNQVVNTTGHIHVHNEMKCADLLREYSRELSR